MEEQVFKRWCIWGHPLHTHTHSYIHNGFFRALKYMGYQCEWFNDAPNQTLTLAPFTIFITEGQVDTYIPMIPNCLYLLHNCVKERYLAAGIPEAHILHMNVTDYRIDGLGENVLDKPWNRYLTNENPIIQPLPNERWQPGIYKGQGRAIHIRWATDLLPPEIQYNMDNLELIAKKRKTGIHFVGFCTGMQQDYQKFLKEYGIEYNAVGGFSDKNLSIEDNIDRVQSSYFAPAIVQGHQIGSGYIPCRIFKNISYGTFVVTNSQAVVDFLKAYTDEYSMVYDTNFKSLTEKAFHRMLNRNFESERKVMAFVRDEHTYVNRVQAVIAGFIHHWKHLKEKGEL